MGDEENGPGGIGFAQQRKAGQVLMRGVRERVRNKRRAGAQEIGTKEREWHRTRQAPSVIPRRGQGVRGDR